MKKKMFSVSNTSNQTEDKAMYVNAAISWFTHNKTKLAAALLAMAALAALMVFVVGHKQPAEVAEDSHYDRVVYMNDPQNGIVMDLDSEAKLIEESDGAESIFARLAKNGHRLYDEESGLTFVFLGENADDFSADGASVYDVTGLSLNQLQNINMDSFEYLNNLETQFGEIYVYSFSSYGVG